MILIWTDRRRVGFTGRGRDRRRDRPGRRLREGWHDRLGWNLRGGACGQICRSPGCTCNAEVNRIKESRVSIAVINQLQLPSSQEAFPIKYTETVEFGCSPGILTWNCVCNVLRGFIVQNDILDYIQVILSSNVGEQDHAGPIRVDQSNIQIVCPCAKETKRKISDLLIFELSIFFCVNWIFYLLLQSYENVNVFDGAVIFIPSYCDGDARRAWCSCFRNGYGIRSWPAHHKLIF